MWQTLGVYIEYAENHDHTIILTANTQDVKGDAPTPTVYMQISKQLQWIANNFNIHVTKAAVARVHVVCLLQKEYEKMGISCSLYLNLYIWPCSQWERESFEKVR